MLLLKSCAQTQLSAWCGYLCNLGSGSSCSKLLRQCGASQVTYRCRKCRTLVATSDNIVDVEAGPGDSAFDWRKRLSVSQFALMPSTTMHMVTSASSPARCSGSKEV